MIVFDGELDNGHVLMAVQETAEKMMQTTIPREHQKLGRQAKGFDRKKWDERM